MKINLYNSAKSYSVTLCNENDGIYDAPAPFEDINAALAYCKEEIDVRQQAISAVIWDTDTGEVFVTCGFDEDNIAEEDYPSWDEDFGWDVGCAVEDDPQDIEWDDHYWDDGCPIDDVDESNYDPYAGCDVYEVEPIDY
jgi:hypothetical protein